MPRNFQQFFGDDSPFCEGRFSVPEFSVLRGEGGSGGGSGGQQQGYSWRWNRRSSRGYVVTNVVDNASVIKRVQQRWAKFDVYIYIYAKVVGKIRVLISR